MALDGRNAYKYAMIVLSHNNLRARACRDQFPEFLSVQTHVRLDVYGEVAKICYRLGDLGGLGELELF